MLMQVQRTLIKKDQALTKAEELLELLRKCRDENRLPNIDEYHEAMLLKIEILGLSEPHLSRSEIKSIRFSCRYLTEGVQTKRPPAVLLNNICSYWESYRRTAIDKWV